MTARASLISGPPLSAPKSYPLLPPIPPSTPLPAMASSAASGSSISFSSASEPASSSSPSPVMRAPGVDNMGKMSSGKGEHKSKKDKKNVANFLNETGDVNDMLEDSLRMTNKDGDAEGGKNDKKHRKRKLEVDLMEKFQVDGKKGKRAKGDGEAIGVGNKEERNKDKITKDDAEASEIGNEKDERKDRKMKKKDKYNAEAIEVEEVPNTVGVEKARKDNRTLDDAEVREVGCDEKKKNKNKKRKDKKDGSDLEPSGVQEASGDTHAKKPEKASKKVKRTENDTEAPNDEQNSKKKTIDLQTNDMEEKNNRKKRKKHKNREVNDDNVGDSNKGKKKNAKSVKKGSNETPKRVSFSDQVEVFPSSDGLTDEENAYEDGPSNVENADKDGLVRGKRFSLEEDEMIKKSVYDYIERHNLGEEGVDMILHCRAHKELKNCWKDIAAALPWRPYTSVYFRGHVLFERADDHKWTADDYELVRKFHEKHGADWRMLADAIGRHRFHVKDTWRRIKSPNLKTGQWSQDEYQNLFDLVNTDLRMKACEEKKSKHGMLRDNIAWESISDKLSTRTNAFCCRKWYTQLTSSMVAEGIWADTDDYRLVDALLNLDACSIEDVDWDNLLEHRPGHLCRKRWNQMVKHLGHLGTKSFAEQVDALSERYCLDVLDAREAYDSSAADS